MDLVASAPAWFTVQCPHSGCEWDLPAIRIPHGESLTEEFLPAQSIRLAEDSKAHIRSHDDGHDAAESEGHDDAEG